jgi:hypothetical protein
MAFNANQLTLVNRFRAPLFKRDFHVKYQPPEMKRVCEIFKDKTNRWCQVDGPEHERGTLYREVKINLHNLRFIRFDNVFLR